MPLGAETIAKSHVVALFQKCRWAPFGLGAQNRGKRRLLRGKCFKVVVLSPSSELHSDKQLKSSFHP